MSKKIKLFLIKSLNIAFLREMVELVKNFSTLNCAYNKGDEDKNVKKNREYVHKKFSIKKK